MGVSDLSSTEAARFLASALRAQRSIVHVGDGDTARQLGASGFAVHALRCGEPFLARNVTYLADDLADAPECDAFVFSACLHAHDLDHALDHALAKAPIVVIDDFSVDMFDGPTAHWFETACKLLQIEVTAPASPHTSDAIKHALAARDASTRELSRVPYLYRPLSRSPKGADLACQLYATERRGISLGAIRPTGLRIVATRGRDTYSLPSPA